MYAGQRPPPRPDRRHERVRARPLTGALGQEKAPIGSTRLRPKSSSVPLSPKGVARYGAPQLSAWPIDDGTMAPAALTEAVSAPTEVRTQQKARKVSATRDTRPTAHRRPPTPASSRTALCGSCAASLMTCFADASASGRRGGRGTGPRRPRGRPRSYPWVTVSGSTVERRPGPDPGPPRLHPSHRRARCFVPLSRGDMPTLFFTHARRPIR